MKLPDGSSPTPSNVSLVSYSPKVEVASISQSSAIISPNELFNIIAAFRNVGEGALVPGHRFEVRLGVHRAFGFPT